jgi:cell division transport system permease protein
MHALFFFFREAGLSLWRGWRGAALAALTIAASLFVLGLFLVINANVQALVSGWTQSAELSVFLRDDVTQEQLRDVDQMAERSGLIAERRYVSKSEALSRFRADYPDLAGAAAAMDPNPLPASFELRLKASMREARNAVDGFSAAVSAMPGVADVRYDRQWLGRLNLLVRGARVIGTVIVAVLALAAAMTVAGVVRLAAAARRNEIEIMQLVGAPLPYVRGPFVVEGLLQGVLGAGLALVALAAGGAAVRRGYPAITVLPPRVAAFVLVAGMLLGCLGGYAAARRVR